MEKMPLISVIIPIHNGEEYVERCVENFIAQSYKNIEIILVNDGSQDNSEQIIKQLTIKDSRIVSVSQESAGASTARNCGIDTALGEYVCFADVDDIVCADYVSYLYALIRENDAEISLVPRPVNFVGDGTGIFDSACNNTTALMCRGIDAAKELLYYKIKESCWSKMFKKSFLVKCNIRFHENLICGEGFNFCTESFIKAQKVAIGYKPIYGYRLDNPNSAMTKFNIGLIRNGLYAIEMIEYTVKNYYELKDACNYAKWHTNCDFFNIMVGCGMRNQYKQEYFTIKKACREMAQYAIFAPVSGKDKIKGMMYKMNPYLTARIINSLRPRKFQIEEKQQIMFGGGVFKLDNCRMVAAV